jgi:hypothetical protein
MIYPTEFEDDTLSASSVFFIRGVYTAIMLTILVVQKRLVSSGMLLVVGCKLLGSEVTNVKYTHYTKGQ